MKWIGAVLIVLCCGAVNAVAAESAERERAFVTALALYDKARTPGEYRTAAAEFEALIAPRYRNDALYYNLGNAYYKAGDFGKAILAYRKAKLFRPRDPWLQANLTQALNAAPGRIAAAPEPFWRNIFFWSSWLSYSEKFNVAWFACFAGIAAISAGTFLRKARIGKAGMIILAAAALLSWDAYSAYRDMNESTRAVVIRETKALKSPGQNEDAAFQEPLKDGAEFTIIERRGDFIFGHFEGYGDGWLPVKNIAE